MKHILKFLGREKEKAAGIKSPVYVFFAEADAEVKTKAYRKALMGASRDQMAILSKHDKEVAKVQ
jgi:hypothetical protein